MYVPPFYHCSGRVTLYGDTIDPLHGDVIHKLYFLSANLGDR